MVSSDVKMWKKEVLKLSRGAARHGSGCSLSAAVPVALVLGEEVATVH